MERFEMIKRILHNECRKSEEKDGQIFYYPLNTEAYMFMIRLLQRHGVYKRDCNRIITTYSENVFRDDDHVSLYTGIKY